MAAPSTDGRTVRFGADRLRWSVAAIGGLLFVTTLFQFHVDEDPGITDTLEVAVPLIMSTLLIGFGVVIARDREFENYRRLLGWVAVGMVLFGTLGAWTFYLTVLEGSSADDAIHWIATDVTIGAFLGAVIGRYDVRQRAEADRAEEARTSYREIFEGVQDGIAIADPQRGTVNEANQRFAEMLGYDREALRGMTVEEISADDPSFDQAAAMERLGRAAAGEPQQFEWLHERADGSQFWAEVSLTGTTIGGEDRLLAVVRDISDRKERERQLAEHQQRLRTILENAPVLVFAVDADGVLTLAEGRGYEHLDVEPEDLVGTSAIEGFDDETGIPEYIRRSLDGEELHVTVPLMGRVFETWYRPVVDDDGEVEQVIGAALDVTEKHRQEQTLEALHEASRELPYAETADAVAEVTVDIAATVLEQPLSTMWLYDEAADRLELAAASESTEAFLAEAGVEGPLPSITSGDVGMEVFHEGELRVVEDYAELDNQAFPELPLGTVLLVPVGDHGLLELGDRPVTAVSDADRYHAEILAANARTALDGVVRERELQRRRDTIETLHAATREMITADDPQTVADLVVETALDVLDLPLTAVWLADGSGHRLEPVAWTDAAEATFGELPTYTEADESISWDVYESGEARVVEDATAEPAAHDPETDARGELVIPLGEHGVLNAGSTEPGAFDEDDSNLAQLLAANAATALARVSREAELRRQTSQMEFFNSILRHDVLNGMTVIRARGAALVDSVDDDQERRYAETIVGWCDDIADVIDRIRTVLDTLAGERAIEPEPVDLSAVLAAEVDRFGQTYPAVDLETEVPDGVSVLADDLLADVLGNLVTNTVEHNDPADLRVRIDVGVDEETVTVRVADDGAGVPDEMKEVIFRRGETAHAKSTGSGFGLFFVDAMVEEYGGEVWVEDSDLGGAAFVMTLPRAPVAVESPAG